MHEIGRAYQYVFIGALEANIRPFENKFHVHANPEKTTFRARNGNDFSFDFNGVYNHPLATAEVFGECKGYSKGRNLLAEFRTFLAKAYVTSLDYKRHHSDYFWFVTNVPFACNEGSAIRDFDFVKASLTAKDNEEICEILGKGNVDDGAIRSLVGRLGVFILTDSYLMSTELSYRVKPGESLWVILKKFHPGQSFSAFGSAANQIASRNNLRSADRVNSGKRIRFSWQGIRKPRD